MGALAVGTRATAGIVDPAGRPAIECRESAWIPERALVLEALHTRQRRLAAAPQARPVRPSRCESERLAVCVGSASACPVAARFVCIPSVIARSERSERRGNPGTSSKEPPCRRTSILTSRSRIAPLVVSHREQPARVPAIARSERQRTTWQSRCIGTALPAGVPGVPGRP